MAEYLTVTEAAAACGKIGGERVEPRELSDALYQGRLDRDRCPLAGRVRLIPRDYLPEVCRVVKEARERRRKPELAMAEK
jgi:hypothetical protein